MFNSLEVTSRTPSMRKSQFHPSRNNLSPPGKISTSLKISYPLPPPRENCLTITETTSNNRTKSQPSPKNFSTPRKFLNPPPKISQPPRKFLNPPPPKISQPSPKIFKPPPPKISQPH